MELPKRKNNRLENYDYNTAGVYFVTICTKNRKPLLCNIVSCKNDTVGDDAHIVPKPIGIVVEKYIRNVPEIEKYVIMPNHIHLLIRIENGRMKASAPTVSVPNIVRSLKILTTKEIGTSIFQRSYHDHIVRDETDYAEIWDYIENNPQKWALDRYYAE
ncbi:MAG: transposase [Clostridia bacterium]|nr:transposase [Clostridia bacterium]